MLNLLSQTKPRYLGAGDMEMVLDGDGHLQRPARIGLGHRLSGVRHRAELHAERESAVFRVRAEEELPSCVWLGLVLLAWTIMFNAKIHKKNKMLKKVFQALVAVLVGATIWLIKIILVKVLASSFHVATYFDRMKESVFHHYILDTLSGPPMDDDMVAQRQNHHLLTAKLMRMKKSDDLINSKSKRFGSRRLDMEKLRKLSLHGSASAWSVKRLVRYVRSFGLSTISTTVDEFGRAESEITSPAYFERKALAHSLNDTKSAVQQLHKLASAVVSVIIIVISLLVMGLATTKFIFFVVTQLVLVGVMFHNTCKTIFESIIFVFVMHPFDIGDRC
ncbi:hypothetical protein C3L33_00643, partial [Rhododendron williamsianum]